MHNVKDHPSCASPRRLVRRVSLSLLTTALLVIGALPVATNAALTDIATTPLASTPSVQVKSNIMLLMDASGSMGWGHMPDEVETVTGINSVGYKSSQCNSLYYNPKTKYLLPKKPDPLATPFAAPSFTAAPYAGFVSYYASPDATDSTTVDLSQSFRAYDAKTLRTATTPDTAQPAYYYVYTGPQTLTYASAPCTDLDTYATDGLTTKTALGAGGGTWTRVTVSATSGVGGTDERANFAMWYSFYRIRISMIKSAASIAFNSLSDSYRVGFILMQPKDVRTDAAINPAKFLALNDFNATQRGLWFSKLFSQTPSGASPAREGLARVGRYYASKEDSINTGMPATGANAPVQYSCQRNFTIMTTDGYWNAQTESPNGGALDINGQLLTTSQDSDLSNPLDASPIYDGSTNGTKVVEDNENSYAYASCGSFAYQSTVQYLQSTTQNITTTTQTTQSTSQMQASTVQNLYATSQNLQSTTQTTSSTSQNLQSTTQRLQSTIQNLQSTSRNTQSTSQNLQSTQQNLQSTTQNLKSTSQNIATTSQVTQTVSTVKQSTTQNLQSTTQVKQSTTQTTQSTTQRLQSTTQNLQSTSQNQQSTTQTTISTAQRLQSTTQALQSTLQTTRSTTQTTQTTSQPTQSTSQLTKSTSQLTITTTQITQTTVQDQSCDASTELCTYVPPGSCTAGGYISCQHYQSGPALVASCTPTTPTAANNYLSTTCATSGTGPTGTSSCTAAAPSSSNNYTRTTCNTTVTSNTPTGSCTAASANSGNAWTTTTCNTVTTGPTIVSSCTPSSATSSNNYVATTCGTATTGPTGVASCTASGPTAANSYTTTTCGTNNTTNVPVASCSASGPAAANNYTTTTCGTNNTTNVPVASCAAASPTSSNNYTTITCSNNNTSNVPVSTCTASGPTSANGYVTTTCTNNNTGPTGTASCTPITATSANSWTTTTCGSNNTTNVGVSSCSPSGPSSSNGYTTTTCSTATTTNVPVATCTASSASSSNNYVTTTCSTNNTTNVPVASCTASAASSSNNYTKTTCANNNTGPTGVASCSAVTASSANNYTATTCGTNNTTNVAVASCTASGPTSSNAYTTTTCTPNNTTNVPVATCTASSPTAANSYVTTTCGTNNTSNVLVASCTPATASSANNYTTTTCATTIVSGPTVVASCTPSAATAANNYQTTSCGTTGGSNPVATCVPSGPTAANNYTTTTCGTTTTTNIPVATCTASGPTAANNYTTTTCSTNNTTNVPVATCTASAATAANNYVTTTCPAPVTTGPTAVASCTPVAATSGNNYVATTCSVGTTGPTAVASCTPVSPTSANAYTTTSCGTVVTTNVPVASCTPSGPTSTNSYTTTTCSTNNTTNVPVASCTGATPTAANNYTRTICSDNNTSNVAVATCTASSPTSANGYTTTTCSTAVTAPVGVASCTPIAASSANNYTATTCGTNNTNNVPVASCTPSGPTSANGYTTTTCPAPATTGPTPIATCTASAATAANNWTTTTCPAPITTTGVAVSSCTPAAASSANNYTTTTCAAHNTGPTAVSSCTPSAATSANNWTATTCNTTPVSTATASCTASGPTAANNYTTTTCSTNNTSNVPVASCTASSAGSGNAYTTTSCSTVTTGPTLQPSCVPDPASAANNYTATTCNAAPGTQITYTTRKTITTTLMNGNIAVGVPTVQVSDTGPFTATQCFSPVATPPALPTSPSPSGVIASLGLTLGPVPPATCSQWPCTTSAVNPPTGSINSLADVAQYYYVTNLRPDLTPNKVKPVNDKPAVESDDATWPHMTTFAVGLGVAGTLTFDPNYRDVSTMTKDFADIRTGAKAWPLWPDPAIKYDPLTGGSFDNWNDPRSIDDFWHAAVNGRGQYFSAKDPTAVVAGLTAALGKIEITTGTGAGAATSSQAPVAGDNSAYVASYQTATWSGEVEARPIDLNSGAVNLDPAVAPTWSAQTMLAKKTGQACDNRLIYLFDATATNNMVEFTWNTSSCDSSGAPFGTPRTGLSSAQMAYFGSSQVQLLSQYASMTDGTLGTVDQRTAATGANLVNFLRGQRGLEKFTTNDLSKLYRSRVSALGDFINSQPVYVKAPSLLYQDAGYSNFVSAQAGRTPMVYVGGNDGMLHAFYAGTSDTDPLGGQEAWAMIPSTVLPNLYKLADANYGNTHQYFVDGTPTVGDISDATGANWKTMLVGGLNSGGKGYYAIDVTDPLNPKAMWEFKASGTCYDGSVATAGADCFIGYTYGQPIITKIADPTITTGRWVVILTSGYNNVHASPTTGDGIGYLYVLDAATGKILYRISTGVGSATTPSGLAQISGYANNAAIDNTSAWVYGGDLLGNIWRFDVNNAITPAGRDATLLGQAKDPSSNPQPITVRPELGELNGLPMVFVGTGRFLGATDVTDTQIQSVYGIVDTLSGNDPVYADLRTALKPLVMTQTGSGSSAVRTIACSGSAAECTLTSGWRIDLDAALAVNSNEVGERVNVPLSLVQGTLIFASNVPSAANAACEANGHGWLNYVNFSTGFAVGSTASSTTGQATGGVRVSDFIDGGLITGFTPIYLPSTGKYRIVGITSGKGSFNPPPPIQPPPTTPGRISWREVAQ